MALAVRSVATGGAATGNVTVTKPAGTIATDYLVGFAFQDPDGSAASLTATGYAQLGTTNTIAGVGFAKAWGKVAGGSEPTTYTFGGSASATSVVTLVCLMDTNAATPVNAGPVNGGSSTASNSHAASSVTTGVANTLLLAMFASVTQNAGSSYNPPAGMTELTDVNAGSWVQQSVCSEAIAASGATGTRTATLGSGDIKSYLTFSVAFAPSSGAAADPVRRIVVPTFAVMRAATF